jgi:hypothetical protein
VELHVYPDLSVPGKNSMISGASSRVAQGS